MYVHGIILKQNFFIRAQYGIVYINCVIYHVKIILVQLFFCIHFISDFLDEKLNF
jgi:hypothetical protein